MQPLMRSNYSKDAEVLRFVDIKKSNISIAGLEIALARPLASAMVGRHRMDDRA